MSENNSTLFSCVTLCWIMAIIFGVLVAVLTSSALGWSGLVCFVLGCAAALLSGWFLSAYFCSGDDVYDDLSDSGSTSHASGASSAAAHVTPTAIDAAPSAIAEPDMPSATGAKDDSGWQGQGNDLNREGADADRSEQGAAAEKAAADKAATEKAAADKAAADKAEAEKAAAEKAAAEKAAVEKAAAKKAAKAKAAAEKAAADKASAQSAETQTSANAAPAASNDAGQASAPQLYSTAPGDADDLKQLKGVGPGLERTLNGLGIYKFSQIASWTEEHIAWVDGNLKFKGRIERDDWVGQAKTLSSGGTTEFAQRVESGDVDY